MKISKNIFLVLAGLVIALVLPMFQVQAAEDATDQDKSVSISFCSVYSLNGYDNGNISRTVSAEGLRVYSFGYQYLNQKGDYIVEISTYGFSSSSNMVMLSTHAGSSTSLNLQSKSVTVDGNTVYYVQLDGFGGGCSPDKISTFHWSDVPNLTMYYENINASLIAKGIAEDMASSGYYNYDDSEWATDRENFSYFSLSGFQYDDSISASWSGIFTDLQLIKDHISDVEVVVSPSFFLILEPGEKYEEFKEPESLIIPLSGKFSRSYDSFFENNPYKGRALLTLSFYPRYYDSATGCMYRGDSIAVKFDAKGKITDVDLPESSLTPIYDPGCYFDSPSSTTTVDSQNVYKTFFRWNRVVTSYVYRSNYIVVDIGYGGKWYSYSKDVFFSDNSISFSVAKLTNFLKEVVSDFELFQGTKIRFTPFYSTSSGSYYGKPIIISLSKIGQFESITELDGDYLDDVNPPDFVDKTPHDWFDDTSLWDNVDYVVDHIKDDAAGTVDLDNLSFNFFRMLKSVINACGEFPALVSTVFSFLPTDISRLLVISLSLIIILRILGR